VEKNKMEGKKPLTSEEISTIVDGFDPIDRLQMELISKMPPGKRIIPMLQATEMIRSGLRAAFSKKFPELSRNEINMRVLEYMTYTDKIYEPF
jgi:hypothetical protein